MHIDKQLLDLAELYSQDTKKQRTKIIATIAGHFDCSPEMAHEFLPDVIEAIEKRKSRRPLKGGDVLTKASWQRDLRLKQIKEQRAKEHAVDAVRRSPMFRSWRADFQDRVLALAELHGGAIRWNPTDDEAAKATLEAICRAARKRGWEVCHTSQGRDGRSSSRYITIPGVGEARVSDHALPETAQRSHNRHQHKPSWRGEVIVEGDWRDTRLDAWMRRVILAAAGRV
jgi:hypothetical protein